MKNLYKTRHQVRLPMQRPREHGNYKCKCWQSCSGRLTHYHKGHSDDTDMLKENARLKKTITLIQGECTSRMTRTVRVSHEEVLFMPTRHRELWQSISLGMGSQLLLAQSWLTYFYFQVHKNFPADWAIAKMYLHGQCCTANRKCKTDKVSDSKNSLDDEDEDKNESDNKSTRKHCCIATRSRWRVESVWLTYLQYVLQVELTWYKQWYKV